MVKIKLSARKVKSYWRQYGTLALAKKIILRICLPFFSYEPLNFYGISGLPRTQLQPRCPLEIRKGGVEDIDLMVDSLKNGDRSVVRKQIKNYFDCKGEVFLGFSEGKLSHIAWLHYCPGIRKAYPLVLIKEDEAFVGRCDTHPAFRGKNIYPVVLQHMLRHAAAKNKKRCFISTSPKNLAAIKGITKAGFSFVWKKQKFRLFGKVFNNEWVSSDARKLD